MYELTKTPGTIFKGDAGFLNAKLLMKTAGNPQNKHKSIHMAATSGKGSTCYLIDSLLRAHGHKTGLTVSPHVYDIRERIQVNGALVEKEQFIEALAIVGQASSDSKLSPSYFETLMAMAFTVFGEHDLDYTIIETGFGGLLDTSNTIERADKVCVLGQIGFDHMAILGNTLEEIALQKAGIIHPGNLVVALRQDPVVNTVFEQVAAKNNVAITWVEKSEDYQNTNNILAETVVKEVAKRDGWEFNSTVANHAVQNTAIPGRFETKRYQNHMVILDGAHNPQKLAALVSRLQSKSIQKATFIVAMGEHRTDALECLSILKPICAHLIVTTYFSDQQDSPKKSMSPAALAALCDVAGIPTEQASDSKAALALAIKQPEPIVATGSFYLLSEVSKAME